MRCISILECQIFLLEYIEVGTCKTQKLLRLSNTTIFTFVKIIVRESILNACVLVLLMLK